MKKKADNIQVPTPKRPRYVLLLLGVYNRGNHNGVARYAREHHWVLDLHYVLARRFKRTMRLDGIVGLITTPLEVEAINYFSGVPFVDMSANWGTPDLPNTSHASVPRVLYDNAAIGRLAAEYFISRGFEHIAFHNSGNFWNVAEKQAAFQATVEAAGRTFHELPRYRWMKEDSDNDPLMQDERMLRRLEKALMLLPKPVAIFTPSDMDGSVILMACEGAGLRVPEEVAVLGCHNEPSVCEFTLVPMSSVDDNLEQQGYEAARLLDRLMDGEPPPSSPIIVPPKGVVTRESTDILAVGRVEVAAALRYIWTHYTGPLQADEVAKAAGVSRRTLERLFRELLKRGISEEITGKRIEHAKTLLLNPKLKAWQVAEQSGFSNMQHFSNAFLREVGRRPRDFRRVHVPKSSDCAET